MELIRHTVESIKHKPYGHKLLAQAKDEVKAVVAATPNYDMCNRQKIIDANKTNTIRHAYYKNIVNCRICVCLFYSIRNIRLEWEARRYMDCSLMAHGSGKSI